MQTRIYVTGRVEIESEGFVIEERQFPGRQGRLLFAYMVCHRQQPVPREELAAAIWGEVLPPAWDAALHALVSKLRSLLRRVGGSEPLELVSGFGSYILRVGAGTWIDREAAAEAIDEAEAGLRKGDFKGAWAPANIAAIAARRPFLPGEEADWLEQERGRLHDLLVRALDCLAEVWLANGEPTIALQTARECIALEPFRESGYQRLIRMQASLGNRGEALRTYEACRELLASELGTDPSDETQALYLSLLGPP